MGEGWGYHICAGCDRAHARHGIRFPFTCACGEVATRLRSSDASPPRHDLERARRHGRDPLSSGGYQVGRAPLLD